MKSKKSSKPVAGTSARYEEAKRLLRANRDLVAIKYYNTYARSQSLKVFFMFLDPQESARAVELVKKLHKLSSYFDIDHRGGYIFGFEVR